MADVGGGGVDDDFTASAPTTNDDAAADCISLVHGKRNTTDWILRITISTIGQATIRINLGTHKCDFVNDIRTSALVSASGVLPVTLSLFV